MTFNLKYICSILSLLISINNYGQKGIIKKNVKIINRGFCDNERKNCARRQIAYFKACNELGDLYFLKRQFDSALKYYEKPLEINDHIYIQTDYAQKLEKKISAKASLVHWNYKHTHEDSLSAFLIDFRFSYGNSTMQLAKLSEQYFHFSKDTFYSGNFYYKAKRTFLFAINPFFIGDTVTHNKIISSLSNSLGNAKIVSFNFACMEFASSERNDAYFSHPLYYIRDSLQRRFPEIHFKEGNVDFNYGIGFPEIGAFIDFPVFEVTID